MISYDPWHAIQNERHATFSKLLVNIQNETTDYLVMKSWREQEVKKNMRETKLKRTKFGVWPVKIEC